MKKTLISLSLGLLILTHSASSFASKTLYTHKKSNIKLEADGTFEAFNGFFKNHVLLGENGAKDQASIPSIQYYGNLNLTYSGLPAAWGNVVLNTYLERKGRDDFALNLQDVKTARSTYIKKFGNATDFIPELQGLSLDFPVYKALRSTVGLYRVPQVGWTGFLFGNRVQNWGAGAHFSHKLGPGTIAARFNWDKPDFNQKYSAWGKAKPQQDTEKYDDTTANRYLFDLAYTYLASKFETYFWFQEDDTNNGDRDIQFFDNLVVERSILGNWGLSGILNWKKFTAAAEFGHNFGTIFNSSSNNQKEIPNDGYMWATQLAWQALPWLKPAATALYFSGNKVTGQNVNDNNTNNQRNNYAYTAGYSLSNQHLADSTSETFLGLPLIASGGFESLYGGIGRPNSFEGVASAKANLFTHKYGIAVTYFKKLLLTTDVWFLRILNPGIKQAGGANSPVQLNSDYGKELDVTALYTYSNNISFSLLSAAFFPGAYHSQANRSDTDPIQFSPITTRDDQPSTALALQLGAKFSF